MPWPEPGRSGQTGPPADGRLEATGLPPLASAPAPVRLVHLRGLLSRLAAAAISLVLVLAPAAALALSVADLPPQPPADHVLDEADLLSRSAAADIARELGTLEQYGIEASWISVPRLDYGLSLGQLGEQLLQRWDGTPSRQLLFLLDGQTSGTAIVASPALEQELSSTLLRSTSRTTMALPLRQGNRYRQASLDAISRLATVLAGEPDPGEPVVSSAPVSVASVPSREQTLSSNATTWVAVLLVVGTVVPMLTWWVFSR